MLVKNYPEFFASYKIYEIVEEILKKNLSTADVKAVLNELMHSEPTPADFIKKLANVLRKHAHSTKASSAILSIKDKMQDLIEVEYEPRVLELTKNETITFKVKVANRTDAILKFRAGLKQLGRQYTAILYDTVKGYSYTKFIKSAIIPPGKMHTYRFVIKAEVFGIQDLYELKEKKKLTISLALQVDAEGVDGMITLPKKIDVNFVKIKH